MQRKSFPSTAEVGRDLWDHLDQQLCAGSDPQSRTPGGLLEVSEEETPQALWAACALSPTWHPSSLSILTAPLTSPRASRLCSQISPLPPKGRRALCPRNILSSHSLPPQRLKSNNRSDLLKVPPAIKRKPDQKTKPENQQPHRRHNEAKLTGSAFSGATMLAC